MHLGNRYSLQESYPIGRPAGLVPLNLQRMEENSSYTVLVVDHDAAICELLQLYLKSLGLHVILAKNGEEALAIVQTQPLDLILLEVFLPAMDGFAVCATIRQESEVPILMLATVNQLDYAARAFQLGADGYITKPFTLQTLKIRLQALLNERRR